MKLPKYRHYKPRNTGMVEWKGKRYYLPGDYNSDESLRVYREFIRANCLDSPIARAQLPEETLCIAGLCSAYLDYARDYYPAKQRSEYKNVVNVVNRLLVAEYQPPRGARDKCDPEPILFGEIEAGEFGPLMLKAYQRFLTTQRAIKTQKKPRFDKAGVEIPQPPVVGKILTRGYINQSIARILRIYRWGVSEQLVPVLVLNALETVPALRKGRTSARETEEIKPVAWKHVESILPQLSSLVRDMVMLQWHTGVRADSLCETLPEQFSPERYVDETGQTHEITAWRPKHKTEYLEIVLYVPLGPLATKLVEPYLGQAKPGEYVFSPRSVRKHARTRDHYDTPSYRQAIERGILRTNKLIDKANASLPPEDRKPLVPAWTPHQLRHSKGESTREKYGIEGVQSILGHERVETSQIYAQNREQLARKIARETG